MIVWPRLPPNATAATATTIGFKDVLFHLPLLHLQIAHTGTVRFHAPIRSVCGEPNPQSRAEQGAIFGSDVKPFDGEIGRTAPKVNRARDAHA